jgi:glycosyltransferase involved in cell wall biosynthesis
MKTVLIYYPFSLAVERNSGSKLRPYEMYQAFLRWGAKQGVEVLLIAGTSAEREKQFQMLRRQGKLEDVWFCYMENQTIPLWLTDPEHRPQRPFVDWEVLRYLRARNVPIGVFYRDVYWKFPDLYPLRGWKKAFMQMIYRREERFYERYCDVIFLPSLEMGNYVSIQRPMVDLPPGGKQKPFSRLEAATKTPLAAIYVGGISNPDYGLPLLLKAIRLANRSEPLVSLTVVCRKDEYERQPSEVKAELEDLRVRVEHVSGEALDRLYAAMDFAFIPRRRSEYNDFSVPVKLVDYLSSGLPIVATACPAQKRLIEADGYGVICEDNPVSMAEAIAKMSDVLEECRLRIAETFMAKHSWEARVEKVKETLVGGLR